MAKKIKYDYFEKEINLYKKDFLEYIGLKPGQKLGTFHLEKKAEHWKNTYSYSVKPGNKTAPKICTLLCKLYEDVRRGVDPDLIEKEFVIIMGMAKKMAAKLKDYRDKERQK